ncbi:DUF6481 family protein [Rhizobium sp. GR12]|uniref:DUF6481 family protein n=1 Tax=Rhizobium sp. GR12 TaxID=3053925 RepID=UPI002FBE5773
MKKPKVNEFVDRRTAAADARNVLINAYRAARIADDPAKTAKREERAAIASAREARQLERERLKEERHRLATEAVDRQTAAALAEIEARGAADKARIARLINDEAERKAERDRRYANRKARQA